MARIYIDIPDDIKDRVYNGVAKTHHYQESVRNPNFDSMYPERDERTIVNPEGKENFLKRIVLEFLVQSVQKAESNEAKRVAEESTKQEVNLS